MEDLIDKYVVEEKKSLLRQKLAKVFELITKTEDFLERIVKRKVKFYEDDYTFTDAERELIEKVKAEYSSFYLELRSAMPQTDEQRFMDMKELKDAISILESFDAESYEIKERAHDAGTGIFYDKMSRKIMYIIDDYKLSEFAFVPIQSIKYYAFSTIKNIKDEDFIPILTIMKETNLISDIIEINPQFQIIVFDEEKKLELSIPEKVLLSFAYDEDLLTLHKLMELTEWKEDYAKKILTELINRGIISVEDEVIKVKSFSEINERIKWNTLIENKTQQEKIEEERKYEKKKEREHQFKKKIAKEKQINIFDEKISEPDKEEVFEEITFKEKPSVKELPSPQKRLEIEKKRRTEEMTDVIDALDNIMPTESTTIKEAEELLENEGPDPQDLVSELILNYHENFSLINGGISQYEKIKKYIEQELENVPEEMLKKTLEQLWELRLIHEKIIIGDYDFFLFKDISLKDDDKEFFKFAINKKPMKSEDFIQGLNWEEYKIRWTIERLQEKGLLRIENDYIIIPGIIQLE
ncbi:MAG: hypothetical protein EU532_11595 [Promethearchaeota archaeon]|nr:MAG: hypothetical protein EU532_11595 [Candidatus Lokiarchaeota archaeon]